MASSKDYLEYISEQLSELNGISFRSMMGEYIVYYRDKIAAYICDNRFLVKPVPSAVKAVPEAIYAVPYEGAKEMLLIESTEDRQFLKELFETIYDELPAPKKRKKGSIINVGGSNNRALQKN